MRIEFDPESGVSWQLTADEARTPADKSYIDLTQGVILTNVANADGPLTTITTESLRLATEQSVASTEDPVTINRGDAQITATGLMADLSRDYFELKANVSVRTLN